MFDLFHLGHLNALSFAASKCSYLIVGVPSDKVVFEDKKQLPIIDQFQRRSIVEGCKYVNEATIYHKLGFSDELRLYQPHVLFVGSDWGHEKRHKDAESWIECNLGQIVQVPRTEFISTTRIKQRVIEQWHDQQ